MGNTNSIQPSGRKPDHKDGPFTVSIIGLRAYPGDFAGTGGIDIYIQNIISRLVVQDSSISYRLYSRRQYQTSARAYERIVVCPVRTVRSTLLETPLYALLASLASCVDGSAVVWYQGVGPAIFSFLPKLMGKRIIITVHSPDWERSKWSALERRIFTSLLPLSFSGNPILTAVSRAVSESLLVRLGRLPAYTPPGIPVRVPGVSNILGRLELRPKKYILYLGRVVPEKRIDMLVDAFAALKNPTFKLVVAGGHGNMPEYESRLRSGYTGPNVVWPGYVFGADKHTLLRQCACIVLPSELEGFPLVLLEAAGAGVPIIASGSAIPRELARISFIRTFPTNNMPALVRLLREAVAGKPVRPSADDARILSRFSWDITARAFLALFPMPIQKETTPSA